MAQNNTAVFGSYASPDSVERAITALQDSGFSRAHVAQLGTLLSILCTNLNSVSRAKEILERTGAKSVFAIGPDAPT